MPVDSQPPPKIPESSGGGVYLIGALVLIGAAVALYFWKRSSTTATPQATTVVMTASAPPKEAPVSLYAPPPPPPLDELDAGVDAGAPAPKTGGVGAAGLGPCGGTCKGQATGALTASLQGRARSAQGCYNRALRTSAASGRMTVSVQVGPSGQVCSASLVNDTVNSNEIASCVLGRFRGQSFPPPSGGCVTVNIPISFELKQ